MLRPWSGPRRFLIGEREEAARWGGTASMRRAGEQNVQRDTVGTRRLVNLCPGR